MDIQKKYYGIEEIAKTINRPTSTIRFWEREMPWLAPKVRGSNNKRKYQSDEAFRVKQVNDLFNWGICLKEIVKAHDVGYFQPLYESLFILHKKYDGTII